MDTELQNAKTQAERDAIIAERQNAATRAARALGLSSIETARRQFAEGTLSLPNVVITADDFKNTTPIKPPPPPPDTTNYSAMTAGEITTRTNETDDAKLTSYVSAIEKILGGAPKEKAADYAATYFGKTTEQIAAEARQEEERVRMKREAETAARAEFASLQAKIQGITNQRDAQNLALEQQANQNITSAGGAGAAITSSFLNVQQQKVNREAAIALLPLQSQALIAQAKVADLSGQTADAQASLKMANDKLNSLIKIKNDDTERAYEYRRELGKITLQYMTEKEKQTYNASVKALDTRIADKKDAVNFVQEQIRFAIQQSGQGELGLQLGALISALPDIPTAEQLKKFKRDTAEVIARIVPKEKATPNIFTLTQTNKGAASSGLSIADFTQLDPDIRNFYINLSPTQAADLRETLVNIENGTQDRQEVLDYIKTKGVSPIVEEYLTGKINAIPQSKKPTGLIPQAWDYIKGLFQ
jgi:hypothetical protein